MRGEGALFSEVVDITVRDSAGTEVVIDLHGKYDLAFQLPHTPGMRVGDNQAVVCMWKDEKVWTDSGVRTDSTFTDPDGQTFTQCRASHLTEFALVLLKAKVSGGGSGGGRDNNGSGGGRDNDLRVGLGVCYLLAMLLCGVQAGKVWRNIQTKRKSKARDTAVRLFKQHIAIVVTCVARALQLMLGSPSLSLSVFFSGVASTAELALVTYLIAVWVGQYLNTFSQNPFQDTWKGYVAFNAVSAIGNLLLPIVMAAVPAEQQPGIALAGCYFQFALSALAFVGALVFGYKVVAKVKEVHKQVNKGSSDKNCKNPTTILLASILSLSSAFLIISCLWLVVTSSAVLSSSTAFNSVSAVYYSMDLCILVALLCMFFTAVTREYKQYVSHKTGTTSSRTCNSEQTYSGRSKSSLKLSVRSKTSLKTSQNSDNSSFNCQLELPQHALALPSVSSSQSTESRKSQG
eukprot:CAMPEP_0175123244 /NCGR_PEP_ID=MMETSP0087-20121206/2139_1 /TAXON_ID=136419 /ORGANISM="Unknown Unknown, Strain D1" /LENGTH=459 /DNA_ID=CAMNT_0016404921 /DNA_START=578 /DNA_END=1957 /DNA_ORIENTATION=-